MSEQQNKFADICVLDAAISRNEMEIHQIDQARKRLADHKKQYQLSNERLQNSRNDGVFELMVSLSHRKFCKLMGI